MNVLSVLAPLWSIAAIALVGLMVYRARLASRETEQLFLNDEDTVSSAHQENVDIVRRLSILTPLCKGFGGAAVVLSFVIAGIWLTHILTLPSA